MPGRDSVPFYRARRAEPLERLPQKTVIVGAQSVASPGVSCQALGPRLALNSICTEDHSASRERLCMCRAVPVTAAVRLQEVLGLKHLTT